MEPLIPSTHNLPAFYTVMLSLLFMAVLSGYALYCQWRQHPPGPKFTRLKWLAMLPLWLLCLLWTALAVIMGVVAGGSAGSLLLASMGLAVVPVFLLLTWGLYHWIRGRTLAYAGMLLLVPAFIVSVYTLQRLWLCEPLALSGLGWAQLCTARLYEHGDGGALRHRNTARGWYRHAAERGVAEAEYQVAGFTRGRDRKIDLYTRAADDGHAGAAYQLYGLLQKDEPAAAVAHLQAAVRKGHTGAQYRLGQLHKQTDGIVERDLARTRTLWTRAAKGGYLSAMRVLAIAYARDGILFDYDPALSRHWEEQARTRAQARPDIPVIEQALEWNWERELQEVRARHARAEAGEAAAQLEIGREILKQAGTDPASIDKAFGWIERAAESGSVEAQYQVANHYLDPNLDQVQPYETARAQGRRWLIAAADGGHEAALRKVITAFKEQTDGMPRDLQRSKAYSEALFAALKARGVLANQPDWMTASWEYSDTLKQIKKEANQYLPLEELKQQGYAGDPAAQYHLAKEIQSKQFAESIALMTASAMAGYPQAQYDMARRYRTRKRTEQEEQQALEWLTAAAESGHRGAMVDLGSTYLHGKKSIGFPRNPYRAKQLFEQALRDREDTVYEQQTGSGRGWKYTVKGVRKRLGRVPESVQRLDLEGLEGEPRREAIEEWYAEERQMLLGQIPEAEGKALELLQKQLDDIEQQRAVLLNEDPTASD